MTLQTPQNLHTRWASFHHPLGRVSAALVSDLDGTNVIVQTKGASSDQPTHTHRIRLDTAPPPVLRALDSALLPHGDTTLHASAYTTDASKRVTHHIVAISFAAGDYQIVTGVHVVGSDDVSPFAKRITAICPSVGHAFFADVHGTLSAGKSSMQPMQTAKVLSHTSQISVIHRVPAASQAFIGGEVAGPEMDDGLVVIGDVDGFLRVSPLKAPERILSLCAGHTAEIVAVAHAFQGTDAFYLVSVDATDTCVVHSGYTGEVVQEWKLRELDEIFCADHKEVHLVSLTRGDATCLTVLCCVTASGLRIFRVEVPTGGLHCVGSMPCGPQEQLAPVFHNSTVELENFSSAESGRTEVPLFYAVNGNQLRTIGIDTVKGGTAAGFGVLVEEHAIFESSVSESGEKAIE